MKSKSIFMGTTKIAASKTAAEIIEVLVDSPQGLQFVIPVGGQDKGFKQPGEMLAEDVQC